MSEILVVIFTLYVAIDFAFDVFKIVRLQQEADRLELALEAKIRERDAIRARYATRPFPRPSYSFNEMRRLIAQAESWPEFDIITDLLIDEASRYTEQERMLLSDALRLVIARRAGL
jgi:hypothetical protein